MLKKNSKTHNQESLDGGCKTISNYKLLAIILTGICGLYVFGLLYQSLFLNLPGLTQNQISGIINFATYGTIFLLICVILNKDILLLKNSFKKWKPYVLGIVAGFTIVAIQLGYSNIVNLYYQANVSDNEASLRSFISLYPTLSIIFLCFIGPMCEELTYRYSILGIFKKYKVVGYIVSILVFSLMHFNPTSGNIINELINLPMYVFSAIALTFTYDKLGLAGSFTAHCVNNLWSVIGILIASNMR